MTIKAWSLAVALIAILLPVPIPLPDASHLAGDITEAAGGVVVGGSTTSTSSDRPPADIDARKPLRVVAKVDRKVDR
jgi:hypothetical protein